MSRAELRHRGFWKGRWRRAKGGGFNIHFLFLALLVASKSSSLFVTIITLHVIAVNCCLYQTVTKSLALIISCINETVLVFVTRDRWVGFFSE